MSFKLCTLVHFGMIFWGKIIEFLKVKQKKNSISNGKQSYENSSAALFAFGVKLLSSFPVAVLVSFHH